MPSEVRCAVLATLGAFLLGACNSVPKAGPLANPSDPIPVSGLGQVQEQEPSKEELAKKLANPVASLISVPIQANFDENIGEDDGSRTTVNIQPVIPFTLNQDWNLISRTILPLIAQKDVIGGDRQSGVGDTLQSLFFSPAAPTESGWIWGVGPVLSLPTASRDELGSGKWGAGPTAVALKQQGPWTYGALANHVWSVAGDGDRADVNKTFLQPFLVHTWPNAVSLSLNSESTYDWEARRWTVPFNLVVNRVIKLGNQLTQVGLGVRYYAESPYEGPEGFGVRLQFTLLYPR